MDSVTCKFDQLIVLMFPRRSKSSPDSNILLDPWAQLMYDFDVIFRVCRSNRSIKKKKKKMAQATNQKIVG